MQPGDVVNMMLYRQSPTAPPVPSTGKVLADFSISAYLDGAAVSVSPTITEIGAHAGGRWQAYKLAITLPGTKGIFSVLVDEKSGVVTPDVISPPGREIEIEAYDMDAVAGVLVVPIVSVVNSGGPQGDISLRVVKSTYAPVAFTVTDQSGAPINLSGYNNPTFVVRNKDQSVGYTQNTGITMTAGGLVTIAIPETASFYSLLSTGVDSIGLYFSFLADEAATAALTRCLARGPVTVLRVEL